LPIENQQAAPGAIATGTVVPPHTYSGYFMGGGVEAPLTVLGPGWFVRSEYRLASYRGADVPASAPIALAGGTALRLQPTVQTVRGEVTYKFNWPR
jgi:outer membrane immunogenic protein